MSMTPNRPYLIRALYDWIVDNGLTPHLLVNAEHPAADQQHADVAGSDQAAVQVAHAVHGPEVAAVERAGVGDPDQRTVPGVNAPDETVAAFELVVAAQIQPAVLA